MLSPAIGAQLARDLVAYATSLTDAEWALVAPFLPAPAETGRPRRWPMRAILDAVLYVLRTGCALGRLRLPPCGTDDRLCRSWRHLPHEFPPWPTVHRWFLRLSWSGVFERLAHALTMRDRARVGREASPTGAVVDAQAARSGGVGVAGARGDDPARRVVGRKRHALTDTDGRLLLAVISPAGLHDSHGGVALLRASRQPWPFLARCLADRACAGERVAAAASVALTIVAAPEGQKGFAVHPRRPPTGNAGRSQANRSELCSDGSSNAPSAGSAAAAGRRATTKRHHPPRSPSSSSPPPWSSSGVSPGRSETGSKRSACLRYAVPWREPCRRMKGYSFSLSGRERNGHTACERYRPMAAVARLVPRPERENYDEVRRSAVERLRTLRLRSDQITPEEWRRITETNQPEIAGYWREPSRR